MTTTKAEPLQCKSVPVLGVFQLPWAECRELVMDDNLMWQSGKCNAGRVTSVRNEHFLAIMVSSGSRNQAV